MARIIAGATIYRHRESDYPKESFSVSATIETSKSTVSKFQIVSNNSLGFSILMNADEIRQLVKILNQVADKLDKPDSDD